MVLEQRLVIMGAGGVGKSALTVRYVQGMFVERYDPTIEDSYRKTVEAEGRHWLLEILDTAGTEQFVAMRDLYMHQGDGFMLVYSMVARGTLQEALDIRQQIVRVKERTDFPCVLVANKSDLASQRTVERAEGERAVQAWGSTAQHVECSALTEQGVAEAFGALVAGVAQQKAQAAQAKGAKRKHKAAAACALL